MPHLFVDLGSNSAYLNCWPGYRPVSSPTCAPYYCILAFIQPRRIASLIHLLQGIAQLAVHSTWPSYSVHLLLAVFASFPLHTVCYPEVQGQLTQCYYCWLHLLPLTFIASFVDVGVILHFYSLASRVYLIETWMTCDGQSPLFDLCGYFAYLLLKIHWFVSGSSSKGWICEGGTQLKPTVRLEIFARCHWQEDTLPDIDKTTTLKHSNRIIDRQWGYFTVRAHFCDCFLSISKLLYFKSLI